MTNVIYDYGIRHYDSYTTASVLLSHAMQDPTRSGATFKTTFSLSMMANASISIVDVEISIYMTAKTIRKTRSTKLKTAGLMAVTSW